MLTLKESEIPYYKTERGRAAIKRAQKKYYKTKKGKAALSRGMRKYNTRLRLKVIKLLGGKCVKCGFSDIRALQVDHIEGGGWKEIKRLGQNKIYHKILKDPTGYQLLCANCNWIKRFERGENRKRND